MLVLYGYENWSLTLREELNLRVSENRVLMRTFGPKWDDVLKLLGEDGFKIMTKLINTIYETGQRPKDFTEVTMIDLKKKPQATKCSDHRTVSLIAHTAKTLRRRIEKKLRMFSKKISLNLEEEKELGVQVGC